jgi:hypothetical protein
VPQAVKIAQLEGSGMILVEWVRVAVKHVPLEHIQMQRVQTMLTSAYLAQRIVPLLWNKELHLAPNVLMDSFL